MHAMREAKPRLVLLYPTNLAGAPGAFRGLHACAEQNPASFRTCTACERQNPASFGACIRARSKTRRVSGFARHASSKTRRVLGLARHARGKTRGSSPVSGKLGRRPWRLSGASGTPAKFSRVPGCNFAGARRPPPAKDSGRPLPALCRKETPRRV